MKKIKVGVLGLGTVGSAFVRIVNENYSRVKEMYGVEIEIDKIFVRDIAKKRDIDINDLKLTSHVEDILDNPQIEVIIECIGGSGVNETYQYLKRAICNKKHIIMSSKKVLALYGLEILALARDNAIAVKFDATVGGGIPIAKILEHCFYGGKIKKITGIVNATSNFICSQMMKNDRSFIEALEEARKCGYAENDASDDIDGYDALYKAVILAVFGFEKYFDPKRITPRSLAKIEKKDMKFTAELGYVIKPLFYIEDNGQRLHYSIGPSLVSADEILGKVDNNNNIIIVNESLAGDLAFYGQGAGKNPTASVIYDDLIGMIQQNWNLSFAKKKFGEFTQLVEKVDQYYLRVLIPDAVGIISAISNIFAEKGINIDKFITKDKENGNYQAVIFASKVEGINLDTEMMKALSKVGSEILCVLPILG